MSINDSNEDVADIEELTFRQLVEFIVDLSDSSDYLKKSFDYEKHTEELLERCKRGTLISRQQLIRTFNDLDQSSDNGKAELYTVDLEELLKELDL